MKKFFQVIFLFLVVLGGVITAIACSCMDFNPNQRKEFKRSETVFIGKVKEVDSRLHPNSKFSRTLRGLVKFKVEKSWKNKVDEIEVWLDIAVDNCYSRPKVNNKYLIYAKAYQDVITDEKYKDTLVFGLFCSRSKLYDAENKEIQKEVKKLNSFWFRFWSRINPF